MQIPLQMLKVGQQGRVGQLLGQRAQVQRLMELGFREGELIEVLQAGAPCIVQLSGTKLCFRQADALSVLVEPIGEESV